MPHSTKLITGLGLAVVAGLLGACDDDGPTGLDSSRELSRSTIILSDTSIASSNSLARSGTAKSVASTSGAGVTYVSLAPGSFPNGMVAVIRNLRAPDTVAAAMTNGGFDPVGVVATPGDTLETRVQVSGSSAPVTLSSVVPSRRRPIVVRTVPPRGKTDVPLNARITVVFSEPVDRQTVTTASLRLMRGSSTVSGRIIAASTGLVFEFVPDGLLAIGETYRIVVTEDVRDLDGDPLDPAVDVQFNTGTALPLASISTDQTALFSSPINGEVRTFHMTAIKHEDQTFSGTYSVFYPGTGGRSGGRVICFTVKGSEIWVAGVVEDAGNANLIGIEYGWRAVDNGDVHHFPDQLSLAYPLVPDGIPSAREFCETTPVTDPKYGDIELNPLESGDIVLRGSDGVPPAPPGGDISLIAFAAAPTGGIRVMRADGLGSRSLTNATGQTSDRNPAWSPDGRRIAFERSTNTTETAGIYVINANGTGLRRLSDTWDEDPVWTPDGEKIVFHRSYDPDNRGPGIYVMNATDGSGVRKLSSAGRQPALAPDGRIAFAGNDEAVHVMNADGSGTVRLTSDSMFARTPAWSPDGRLIAFQGGPRSGCCSTPSIYVVNVDGSNLRRAALGGYTPAWSPDSRMIVYEWFGLNVINADGSGLTRRGSGFMPAWSPVGTMPQAPQPTVSIQIAGGDAQADTVRATLAHPLSVRLVRDDGSPVTGIRVNFVAPGAGGALGPTLSSASSITDSSGVASVRLTLGGRAGGLAVQALVANGTARSTGVEFTATAKAGLPVTLLGGTLDSLLGTVDSTVEYVVYARDAHGYCGQTNAGPQCGNLVTGVPITWEIIRGDGSISPARDTTKTNRFPGKYAAEYPISLAVHALGPHEDTTVVTATAPTIASVQSTSTFTTKVVTKIVTVSYYGFSPDSVEVPAGRTVAWQWFGSGDSDDRHNVTFEDAPAPPVSSPTQGYGSLTRTFTGNPGTVRYRCTVHGEVGVVVVR